MPPYTIDPFTGKKTSVASAATGQHQGGAAMTMALSGGEDEDSVIQRLIEMLSRNRQSESGERRESTRRRMYAVDPRRARRVERGVRRERGRDRVEAARPGNAVRSWERGGTAKPPSSTFNEAGISEEDAEGNRDRANRGRIRRLLGQKEAKLAGGTQGSFSMTGPDGRQIEGGGGEFSAQDEMALQERIRKLKQMLGQPV